MPRRRPSGGSAFLAVAGAKLGAGFGDFVIDYQKDTGYQNHTRLFGCPGPATKSQHQAVRDTLEVISGKWKLVILAVLLTRPYRFKELSREINISPRVLSKELQDLETHQLVTRTVCDTRPITAAYASTPHSQTLVAVVQAMSDWGYLRHEAVVGRKRADDLAVG